MELKKILLTAAVGILLALFFGFLVDAVYPNPRYEDFCRDQYYNYPIEKAFPDQQQNCTFFKISDELKTSCPNDKGYIAYNYTDFGCVSDAYCETCNTEFDNSNKVYSRNLFFMLVPISIILIVIGFFLSLESIGSGFILGGILTIAYATIRIFGDLSKFMRVILLGVELIIVIWLGYNRIEKANSKKRK